MWTLAQKPAFWPGPVDRLEDLDIPHSLATDLILRYVYRVGIGTLASIRDALHLSIQVVEIIFSQLRQQQLVDVRGMKGHDYVFSLTAAGRTMAGERSQVCQYAGPAPVSLDQYTAACRMQAARVKVSRAIMRNAFSDLVLSDRIVDQLGPALISQKSLFLYGPTGNGKTSIAERMLRVYNDFIVIPHALEVDGNIITIYDPVMHCKVDVEDAELDPRWLPCERPCVVAGGELAPTMLELRIDEASGTYSAPLQMKANNGIFIIDDFGRQLMSPRNLLNRWIVPLDRRVDYLTLRHGYKFQIPFETMVVFSTNLDPSDLADEAFLRRIPNKIYIDAVSDEIFDEIFMRVTARRKIPFDPGASAYLRKICIEQSPGLRAAYVNDVCDILLAIGQYEGEVPEITCASLERATKLYFTQTDENEKNT